MGSVVGLVLAELGPDGSWSLLPGGLGVRRSQQPTPVLD